MQLYVQIYFFLFMKRNRRFKNYEKVDCMQTKKITK